MEDKIYQSYLEILQEELVPALGCTEPIALAYAAASAREVFRGYARAYGCLLQREYH